MLAIETLKIRLRSTEAILVREAKNRFGSRLIGLLMAFSEPLVQVAFFSAIFIVTDRQGPHGVDIIAFVISGVMPYHLFSKTMTRGMGAIEANKKLLAYPILKPIDTIMARVALEIMIYVTTFALLIMAVSLMGSIKGIPRYEYVFLGICLSSAAGFSGAILAAALLSVNKMTKTIVPIILRIGFLTSGVFFSASMIPSFARDIFLWNPFLHISEMIRYGLFENFPGRHFSIQYMLVALVAMFAVATAALALAERTPNANVRG